MREYSGHARPRPSGEEPGDSAGYARGYSRDHIPGWADDAGHRGDGYRGHGPRRAQPQDEDLLDTLCERLSGDPDIDASEIDVTVREGIVALSGTVPSRQTRRDAEAIAESLRGASTACCSMKANRRKLKPSWISPISVSLIEPSGCR